MPSRAIDLLVRYRKPIALTLGGIVIAVGSYALGRYGTPERVVVQERVEIVEVEKEKVVVVEKEVEKKVYVQASKKSIHREENEKVYPDGTVERSKVEDINVDRVVKETEVKVVEVEVEKEVVVEREVEKEVLVEKTVPMPDWRVSPLVGVNGPETPGLLAGDSFDPLQHLSFGAHVERRIWGPVSAGAWALSTGQVGLSASVEF